MPRSRFLLHRLASRLLPRLDLAQRAAVFACVSVLVPLGVELVLERSGVTLGVWPLLGTHGLGVLVAYAAVVRLTRPAAITMSRIREAQSSRRLPVKQVELPDEYEALARAFEEVSRERDELQTQIRVLQNTDGLTGAFNRRYFGEHAPLEQLRSRENRKAFTLLYVDLDGFTHKNREIGHQFGDLMLKRFCDVAQSCLRYGEWIARVGGDEFIFVLPGATLEDAAARYAAIQQKLAQAPIDVEGHDPYVVSGSFGTATDDGNSSLAELQARADSAMYLQKARRRTLREQAA